MPRIWKRLILPAIGVATLAAALAPSTMALAEGPPAVTDLPPVADTAELPGIDAEVDGARPSNGSTYLKGTGTLEGAPEALVRAVAGKTNTKILHK